MSTRESLRIVVLGAGGVGKSALTIQFIQSIYVEKYDPTIEDSYRKVVELDGRQVMTEITDTAGTEQFTAMRDLYIRNGHAFALVYSIAAKSSFNDIDALYEQIVLHKDSTEGKVPIVLVGNKSDMYTQRIVTTEQGSELAKKFKCRFLETSAKNRQNVDEVFLCLVRDFVTFNAKKINKSETKAASSSTRSSSKKNKGCQLF